MNTRENNLKIRFYNSLSSQHKYISNPNINVPIKYMRDVTKENRQILRLIFPNMGFVLGKDRLYDSYHYASQNNSAHLPNRIKNIDKDYIFFNDINSDMEKHLTYIKQNDPVISNYLKSQVKNN